MQQQQHELHELRDTDALTYSRADRSSQATDIADGDHLHSTRGSMDNDTGEIDTHAARSVVRKLDRILLPFLCALFLLNSLDKSNIGNAETAGFSQDTGLAADDLNTSMAFFFAFFVALQPVSALLGRYFGMSRWVPSCMALWGLCTVLHVFVRSREQLILLRIAIAVLEAGFYPTTVQYLSLFYTRNEFAFRLGFFYGQSTLAGALGALLSWLVFSIYPEHQAKETGMHPWQLLFILEGCLTIGVASLGFFWLPRDMETAWFLTALERRTARDRVKLDRATSVLNTPVFASSDDGDRPHDDREGLLQRQSLSDGAGGAESIPNASTLSLHEVQSAFLQVKIWHLLVCNILSSIPATAFAVFLPVVIKEMSTTELAPATSNLLAAPPFICAAISVLLFTKWSDSIKQRLGPIACGFILLCSGLLLVVLLPDGRPVLRYLSICIILSGSFIASPLTVAWITDNTPEPGKRAVLLGINGWGNIAGVTSAFLFTSQDAVSGYAKSFGVTLCCAIVSACGYGIFYWRLKQENAWRHDVLRNWTDEERWQELLHGDAPFKSDVSWARKAVNFGPMSNAATVSRAGDQRITYRYTF